MINTPDVLQLDSSSVHFTIKFYEAFRHPAGCIHWKMLPPPTITICCVSAALFCIPPPLSPSSVLSYYVPQISKRVTFYSTDKTQNETRFFPVKSTGFPECQQVLPKVCSKNILKVSLLLEGNRINNTRSYWFGCMIVTEVTHIFQWGALISLFKPAHFYKPIRCRIGLWYFKTNSKDFKRAKLHVARTLVHTLMAPCGWFSVKKAICMWAGLY